MAWCVWCSGLISRRSSVAQWSCQRYAFGGLEGLPRGEMLGSGWVGRWIASFGRATGTEAAAGDFRLVNLNLRFGKKEESRVESRKGSRKRARKQRSKKRARRAAERVVTCNINNGCPRNR